MPAVALFRLPDPIELVSSEVRLRSHHSQEPGVGISSRHHPGARSTLPDAAAESSLYGCHSRQTVGCASWTEEGRRARAVRGLLGEGKKARAAKWSFTPGRPAQKWTVMQGFDVRIGRFRRVRLQCI
jgi:hypothetical protein